MKKAPEGACLTTLSSLGEWSGSALVAAEVRAVVAQEVLDVLRRRSACGAVIDVDLVAVDVDLVDEVRLDLDLAALARRLDVCRADLALQLDRAVGHLDRQLVVLDLRRGLAGRGRGRTFTSGPARRRAAGCGARSGRLRSAALATRVLLLCGRCLGHGCGQLESERGRLLVLLGIADVLEPHGLDVLLEVLGLGVGPGVARGQEHRSCYGGTRQDTHGRTLHGNAPFPIGGCD